MMIRKELKTDPTGFVSKNLEGVRLSVIEELYLVNKCPNLFNFILYPSVLAQRLYIYKESTFNISIANISDTRLIKKVLRKRPQLCVDLDIVEFEKDVCSCIDLLHKNRDIYILEKILSNDDITNNILRKILFLEPRLVKTAIQNGIVNFDQDIEMYIFKTNPLLLESFEKLSAKSITKIFRLGIDNVLYIRKWLGGIEKDILIHEICDHIMKSKINCNYSIIREIICSQPDIFKCVIKTLYKNGFDMNTNFTVRLLLKEFNDLIDDELASVIVEANIS